MRRAKSVIVLMAVVTFAAASTSPAVTYKTNFNQTFTNRTNSAAGGFRWWFTPNCGTSGVSSSVFTSNTVTGYPNPIYNQPSAVEIYYSNGNVNVGGSATMRATLHAQYVAQFRAEWTDASGVPIGTAYLPCSFGGSYLVQGAEYVWDLPIDNPSETMVMRIENLEYSLSQLDLTGPNLDDFTGTWTLVAPAVDVPTEGEYVFQVTAPPGFYPVVQADLYYPDEPDSDTYVRYEVLPEPVTVALLGLGGLAVVLRRRRPARRCR